MHQIKSWVPPVPCSGSVSVYLCVCLHRLCVEFIKVSTTLDPRLRPAVSCLIEHFVKNFFSQIYDREQFSIELKEREVFWKCVSSGPWRQFPGCRRPLWRKPASRTYSTAASRREPTSRRLRPRSFLHIFLSHLFFFVFDLCDSLVFWYVEQND